MYIFSENIPLVLWIAVIPALVAVSLIFVGVAEPGHEQTAQHFRSPLRLQLLY
jgi:hypothetical protein